METSGGPYLRKFVGHQAQLASYGTNESATKLVSGSIFRKYVFEFMGGSIDIKGNLRSTEFLKLAVYHFSMSRW